MKSRTIYLSNIKIFEVICRLMAVRDQFYEMVDEGSYQGEYFPALEFADENDLDVYDAMIEYLNQGIEIGKLGLELDKDIKEVQNTVIRGAYLRLKRAEAVAEDFEEFMEGDEFELLVEEINDLVESYDDTRLGERYFD